MKILLTAPPGTGKSTLLQRVIEGLRENGVHSQGVSTKEIRNEKKDRIGFMCVMDNNEEILFMKKQAEGEISDGEFCVGRYLVDVHQLDSEVLPYLRGFVCGLLYLDELGPAQALSANYLCYAREVLTNASLHVLGTIAVSSSEWCCDLKNLPDIWTIVVTKLNREELVSILVELYRNTASYDALTFQQRVEFRELFNYLLERHKISTLNKLVKNCLLYMTSGAVHANSQGHLVKGLTNRHVVRFDDQLEVFTCDCPLHLREGKFQSSAGEACSHVMSVILLEKDDVLKRAYYEGLNKLLHEPVVEIRDKQMMSRILYCNPVCMLVSPGEHLSNTYDGANVMTISWLTPLDNRGGLILSMNRQRHTCDKIISSYHSQRENTYFVLCIPVEGMEKVLVDIGSCSGVDVDKRLKCGVHFHAVGLGVANSNYSHLPAVEVGVCAQIVCRVVSISSPEEDPSHALVRASCVWACVKKSYWHQNKLFGVWEGDITPPPMCFAGSGNFISMRLIKNRIKNS